MIRIKKLNLLQAIAFQLFSFPIVFCQSGYSKIIGIENSASLNVDDIKYKNSSLYIAGNSYNPDIGIWGTYILKMDTTGTVLWSKVLFDSLKESDLVTNTPTRFSFGLNNELLLLALNFQTYDNVLLITDSLGNKILQKQYATDDFVIFAIDVVQIDTYYYIFGIAQRPNYKVDNVVLKIDSSGNLTWKKYYGASSLDEVFGDVWVNPDNTFTITASASKDGWYNEYKVTGSNKPWIFTIDTSGDILSQWFGNYNDVRTNGRGPLYRAANGDYIVASYDIKGFPGTLDPVRVSPTVTRLDSSFNLVWKRNLTNFTNYWDKIQDMAYDSVRDEFIVTGNQRIFYTPDSLGADVWFEKISGDGEIIWNRSDTAIYLGYGQQEHFTAGIAIAPSGSLYIAGWVYSDVNHEQGWIIKVTPDGCSDTLCTITSLQDQMLLKQNNIFIRPNPVSDELHLFLPEGYSDAFVDITNLQGESICHQSISSGENIISTDYPTGIYFYKVETQNQIIGSGKFIKL